MYSHLDITKGQGTGKNLFAITRFRYIEVLLVIFYYYWGKENRSLYRGLRYIEVRFIEVPQYILKLLSIQTFRDYCPFISGRCRYTERASFYSNVATFEARAGRVRSNKIEVNVYAARL